MKKDNFLKKYQILIILGLTAGMMGMIKLEYKDRKWEEAAVPTPTLMADREYPLWKLLPYSGEGFVIDRYAAPWTLAVKIIKGTKTETEKKVGEWLKAQGEAGENHELVISNW